MKNFVVLIFLFCSAMLYGQGYTVKLKISNVPHDKIRLVYFEGDTLVANSNYVKSDGWIVFEGIVKEPLVSNIIIANNPSLEILTTDGGIIPGPDLSFFLSNDIIEILGEASILYASTVNGGVQNKEWTSVKYQLAIIEGANWLLLKNYFANKDRMPEEDRKTITSAMEENKKIGNLLKNEFIDRNTGSLVSLFYLTEMMHTEVTLEELQFFYTRLDDNLKTHSYAKNVLGGIAKLKKSAIGLQAMNFQRTTNKGVNFNLDDLKGKYVLLDFWGSWCVPCRISHPHLLSLYNKYKGDSFEIVGIAQESGKNLEQANVTWRKAIEIDKLIYINVLNNEETQGMDIVNAYGISAFPTKVLLDKNGIIIARFIGDDPNLDENLKSIFGF